MNTNANVLVALDYMKYTGVVENQLGLMIIVNKSIFSKRIGSLNFLKKRKNKTTTKKKVRYCRGLFLHIRHKTPTWKPQWAAPPSALHPGRGCGSEISWGLRQAPCPGSPFHLPHSWYVRRGMKRKKANTSKHRLPQFLCSSSFTGSSTGMVWPRFYHGGYVSEFLSYWCHRSLS